MSEGKTLEKVRVWYHFGLTVLRQKLVVRVSRVRGMETTAYGSEFPLMRLTARSSVADMMRTWMEE